MFVVETILLFLHDLFLSDSITFAHCLALAYSFSVLLVGFEKMKGGKFTRVYHLKDRFPF